LQLRRALKMNHRVASGLHIILRVIYQLKGAGKIMMKKITVGSHMVVSLINRANNHKI